MKKVPQVFQLIFDSQFTAEKGQMTHCNYESLLYMEQYKKRLHMEIVIYTQLVVPLLQ